MQFLINCNTLSRRAHNKMQACSSRTQNSMWLITTKWLIIRGGSRRSSTDRLLNNLLLENELKTYHAIDNLTNLTKFKNYDYESLKLKSLGIKLLEKECIVISLFSNIHHSIERHEKKGITINDTARDPHFSLALIKLNSLAIKNKLHPKVLEHSIKYII